jgi:hypothetical protein
VHDSNSDSFVSHPNAPVHPPGPLQKLGVARNRNAAPVAVQRLDTSHAPASDGPEPVAN